jgi:RimJ/RimL family protein N-acetyltransferase
MPAALPDISLLTRRLEIRPPRESDLDAVVAGIGDFEVSKWLAKVPHPYARADAEWWLAHAIGQLRSGEGISLVVSVAGRVIGGVGIHGLPEGRPALGYWLARAEWGKGYGTEAARALAGHAFGRLGLDPLHASVFEGNTASLGVQLKLGFEITGRGTSYCLAQKAEVPNIETLLTAQRFRALNPAADR